MSGEELHRLVRDLSDSGFRGVIKAYYVKRGLGTLTIEFIIYRKPNTVRRLWMRIRRSLEVIPSLVMALVIGFVLALIMRWFT
ncbi:sodium:solute symporter [Vulcanisaeta souniana]|uniref:Sodium:solute symporter n=1 Tax=Vulcanisaeta souniana JCM 11219 TaxID=1293586 RepID=A0A830EF97_9CREN|nr:sodium:solute symporter [Vulcanisaeta souniana]BDR93437.1 hypothetical protein Vsou_25300 [Vulcanisaeta souniana JCM 11219]GGI77104.1 hypothetical protein GCM10007112_12400 [Vulcanisaeta souniana JCM 11219]